MDSERCCQGRSGILCILFDHFVGYVTVTGQMIYCENVNPRHECVAWVLMITSQCLALRIYDAEQLNVCIYFSGVHTSANYVSHQGSTAIVRVLHESFGHDTSTEIRFPRNEIFFIFYGI